jgi:hypothetical protein
MTTWLATMRAPFSHAASANAAPKNCARRDTALQSAAVHISRVMEQCIIYVGFDVHKDTIAVAVAEAGLRGEVREHGKIAIHLPR